jgi:hypothetical protein
MFEFNGWFVLKESAPDQQSGKVRRERIDAVTERISQFRWNTSRIDIVELDRQFCLRLTGMLHRNRGQSQELHDLLTGIARDLPGSYGLLYEWSDQSDLAAAGAGQFQVHVLEAGVLSHRPDPFLSATDSPAQSATAPPADLPVSG